MIGEDTGRKVTPTETSRRMRSMRDTAGKKVFGKEDWLTVQQITSYFSRVAKKLGKLQSAPVTEDEEDEVDVALQTAVSYNLLKKVFKKLIL